MGRRVPWQAAAGLGLLVLSALPSLAQASPKGDDDGLGGPFVVSPVPEVRLALGPGWGQSTGNSAGPDLCFTLAGGPRLLFLHRPDESGFWLQPELGYSFRRTYGEYEHQLNLGLALGYTLYPYFSPGYMVWFSAGNLLEPGGEALFGTAAVGIRHGLRLATLYNVLSLELSHQALATTQSGTVYHDLRLLFGLDLGMIGYAISRPFVSKHW